MADLEKIFGYLKGYTHEQLASEIAECKAEIEAYENAPRRDKTIDEADYERARHILQYIDKHNLFPNQ